MHKPKILLITRECLSNNTNEGNVLLGLFGGGEYELANIYCKAGVPDNNACADRYFQLTDKMALQKLLKGQPMGRRVHPVSSLESGNSGETEKKGFYDFFRKHNLEIFHFAREILWKAAGFHSAELDAFVDDFRPDLIFSPLCYSWYVLALQRYVIGRTSAPAATYLYDDLYSFRQMNLEPFFWLNRLFQRRIIRKTLPCFNTVYSMSPQQADVFGKMLGQKVSVLPKIAADTTARRVPHDGIRIIYGGGTYYGRAGTLSLVADAVRALHREGVAVQLDVYTSSPLDRKTADRLNDGVACRLHGVIPFTELMEEYAASDIALHVESFIPKHAHTTQYSFSTKIVDCLGSGCAVLAICPEYNSGWQYLRDEKAACCVSASAEIESAVRQLVLNDRVRQSLTCNAEACLKKNHNVEMIRKNLYEDLLTLMKERPY